MKQAAAAAAAAAPAAASERGGETKGKERAELKNPGPSRGEWGENVKFVYLRKGEDPSFF